MVCVGHEPQLGEVVSLLLCGKAVPNFPLKKAGAVLVESEGVINQGEGRLCWWLQPRQLRIIGKRAYGRKRAEQS